MIVFAWQNRFKFSTIFAALAHAQTFFRGVLDDTHNWRYRKYVSHTKHMGVVDAD